MAGAARLTPRPPNPPRDAFPYHPAMAVNNFHMEASLEHRRAMDWHHHHHRDASLKRRFGGDDMERERALLLEHGRMMERDRMPPRIGPPGGRMFDGERMPNADMGMDRRMDGPGILHLEGRNLSRRMDGPGLPHTDADSSMRPGFPRMDVDPSMRRMEGPSLLHENLHRRIEGSGLLHPEGGMGMRRMDSPGVPHPEGEITMRRLEGPPLRRMDGPGLMRPETDVDLWRGEGPGPLRPENDVTFRKPEISSMLRPEEDLAARRMEGPSRLPAERESIFRRSDGPGVSRSEGMNAIRRSDGHVLRSEGNRASSMGRAEDDSFHRGTEGTGLLRPEGDGVLRRMEGPGVLRPEGNNAGRRMEGGIMHLESDNFLRRVEGPDILPMDGDVFRRREGPGILENNFRNMETAGLNHLGGEVAVRRGDGPGLPSLDVPRRMYGTGNQNAGEGNAPRRMDGPVISGFDGKNNASKHIRHERRNKARLSHSMNRPRESSADGVYNNHDASPELNIAALDRRLEDADDSALDNLERRLEGTGEGSLGGRMELTERRSEGSVDVGINKSNLYESKMELSLERGSESANLLGEKFADNNDRRLEQDGRLDKLFTERRLETATLSGADDRKGYRSLRSADSERSRPASQRDDSREKVRDKSSEEEKQKDADDGSMQELVMQYKTALAELTFNSKPIITNLTIIAGENLHASNVIASIICDHILEVPIEQKLPCLYLLDSIVKNIRSTYVNRFGARLPEIFIKSYRQMDPSLHPAMQHLFKTWRGIYDEPLRMIERELQFNILGNNSTSSSVPLSNSLKSDDASLQRSGPSIHVNPKYLEAQRQKQQSSQVNDQIPQTQKTKVAPVAAATADPVRISSPDLPDHDFLSVERREAGSIDGESLLGKRWTREEETPVENVPPIHGLRTGPELQQLAPEPLLDVYGNIRGIRAPKVIPVPASQDLNSRSITHGRSWTNVEDEEYRWVDPSFRQRDAGPVEDSFKSGRDEKYLFGERNSVLSGGKPFGGDPLPTDPSWHKHATPLGLECLESVEARALRDLDEMAPLSAPQQDYRPRPAVDSIFEAPISGKNGHNVFGYHPINGRLHPQPLHIGATVQSRPRPMQINRNLPPPVMPAFQGSPVSNSGAMSGSGQSPGTNSFPPLRSSAHFNVGSSSGHAAGTSSPVTPVSAFQQRQQGERPYSPPSFAALPNLHVRPPFFNSQAPDQQKPPSSQDIVPPYSADCQGKVQPPSQQPPPMHLPQRPHLNQYVPQPTFGVKQGLQVHQPQHTPTKQPPDHSPTQNAPMLPQIPAKLLESLQQLQSHLPSSSGNLVTQNQPTPFLQQPMGMQNQVPQPAMLGGSDVGDGDTASLSGVLPNKGSTDKFLAAFLNSGLIPPPQVSQVLPLGSNPVQVSLGPSDVVVSQGLQAPPPLPSGPPPLMYSTTDAIVPPGQPRLPTLPTTAGASMSSGPSQPFTSTWSMQPPLPPGPPPQASQVSNVKPQSPSPAGSVPTPGNNITSLLSSLMAQGVISAAPPSAPLPMVRSVPNVISGVNVNNVASNEVADAGLSTLLSSIAALTPIDKINGNNLNANQCDPSLLEFKQEQLRERQDDVINALYYNFPRQCKTCGLRFKLQEEHCKHMDWHVSRNRRQKHLRKVSRKWFVSAKEWLNGTGSAGAEVAPSFIVEDATNLDDNDEDVAVPADENQSVCALCGEPFEDFYSDEMEEWMYKGAVYMNAPTGMSSDSANLGSIVHAKCRSESADATASDFIQDADLDDESNRRKRVRF